MNIAAIGSVELNVPSAGSGICIHGIGKALTAHVVGLLRFWLDKRYDCQFISVHRLHNKRNVLKSSLLMFLFDAMMFAVMCFSTDDLQL